MPNNGINLIPELTEKDLQTASYRKKASTAAIYTLVAVGLIILALGAYQVVLKLRSDDIKRRTDQATAVINEHQDIEISQLTLKQKIDQAKSILQNALPGSVILSEINQAALASNVIIVKHVTLGTSGDLSIEGEAPNSTIFSAWIDNLTTGEAATKFQKIFLNSLIKTSGGYDFSMDLDLTPATRGFLQ